MPVLCVRIHHKNYVKTRKNLSEKRYKGRIITHIQGQITFYEKVIIGYVNKDC